MKWKSRITYVMLGVTLIFVSCVDDNSLYKGKAPEYTADLIVPQGFGWSVVRNVSFSVQSPKASVVSVYSTPECSENSLLAILPVSSQAIQVTLYVADASEAIYVQYPVKDGKKAVLTKTLDPITRAEKPLVLPEDIEAVEVSPGYNDLMTLRTSGMVAFEDNWPELGDYDMNDLVASYIIDTHIADLSGSPEAKEREGISVTLYLHAIGGVKPVNFGVKLDQIPAKYVSKVIATDSPEGLTVRLANDIAHMDEDAVILVSGLEKLKNGKLFYNTESAPSAGSYAPAVCIRLLISDKDVLHYAYNSYNQNFFITTVDGREIHLKGYEPSFLYPEEGIEYCNPDGFVWGMKLPSGFAYPVEKTDILKCYDGFADWVLSGGARNTDWYKSPNGNVIPPTATQEIDVQH